MIDHAPASRSARDEAREHEIDTLVAITAALAERLVEPDPRFLDWQAAELRARRRPTLAAEARADARARRLGAAALGARFGVRCVPDAPVAQPAPVAGTLSRVINPAAEAGCAPRLELGIAAGAGRVLWDEPCDSWLSIPDDLPRGRYVALTVKGDSMLPLLHSEDVVLVKIGSEVARDSIVVARRPDDGYVVKRVGRVGPASIELLSLNPDFPTTLVERAEGTVAGTVVLRWCQHGV
ncbi:MAG TPA: S24 family peptidase [Gemmatimonadaceae bacterium]|nr:S24 family peptidase [Gemmatimonadaceae bacterium]